MVIVEMVVALSYYQSVLSPVRHESECSSDIVSTDVGFVNLAASLGLRGSMTIWLLRETAGHRSNFASCTAFFSTS
jgi:hypothetical protein